MDKAEAFSGIEITYVMMVTGAVVFGAAALLEAASAGTMGDLLRLPLEVPGFLKAIIYTGIGSSVLGFFLSNLAIAKIGVNRTSSFIGVSTVVSILAGGLLLRETFTGWQMAGVITVLAGVYIANAKVGEE